MKNVFLTIVLFFSFLISFSQSKKKYTVTDEGYNDVFTLNYEDKKLPIEIMFNTENYFFFKLNDTVYKIERSKINFAIKLIEDNELYNYSIGKALVKFSNQSQFALVLQLLAPGLLFLNNEVGIYSTLGVSLAAAIIHIDAFRHLKTFAKIESAIEYPY